MRSKEGVEAKEEEEDAVSSGAAEEEDGELGEYDGGHGSRPMKEDDASAMARAMAGVSARRRVSRRRNKSGRVTNEGEGRELDRFQPSWLVAQLIDDPRRHRMTRQRSS